MTENRPQDAKCPTCKQGLFAEEHLKDLDRTIRGMQNMWDVASNEVNEGALNAEISSLLWRIKEEQQNSAAMRVVLENEVLPTLNNRHALAVACKNALYGSGGIALRDRLNALSLERDNLRRDLEISGGQTRQANSYAESLRGKCEDYLGALRAIYVLELERDDKDSAALKLISDAFLKYNESQ